MSTKYPGGLITKSPVVPSGPTGTNTAPGIWTLEQAAYYQKLGQWPIKINPYVEDVFSTYLYTGNGTTQTITNGIDLAGKGGMVWLKSRTNPPGTYDGWHRILDTNRGTNSVIYPNDTYNAEPINYVVNAFNSNGFSISNGLFDENKSGFNYASWTFREQPNFLDVVTYTGNATAGREIPHSLGSAPGCIIVKSTSAAGSWWVYHRSLGATQRIALEDTAAAASNINPWFNTTPTSTVFTLSAGGAGNDAGTTYVAYLFAHDAGGFGATGTENVVSCGSVTTATGDATVTLGYEPQWVLWKKSDGTGNWHIADNMRGFSQGGVSFLNPNLSAAESAANGAPYFTPTATGFSTSSYFGAGTYIYVAIRRGPMKTPTLGTSVFSPVLGTSTTPNFVTNFAVDFSIVGQRIGSNWDYAMSRLQGGSVASGGPYMVTNSIAAESAGTAVAFDIQNGFGTSGFGSSSIGWSFRRAPSFFDEICYTSSAGVVSHNLGVSPELVIYKPRSVGVWHVCVSTNGFSELNSSAAWVGAGNGSGLGPNLANATATTIHAGATLYGSGTSMVTYLFATCPGVSKVGSYTGNGTSQTIPCGFAAGARFVLIKRTDAAGGWYTWDSARGITSGNDPYLLLNSTAAEVTGTNYVDTDATGFKVTAAAPAEINAVGGTYIFLAVA